MFYATKEFFNTFQRFHVKSTLCFFKMDLNNTWNIPKTCKAIYEKNSDHHDQP